MRVLVLTKIFPNSLEPLSSPFNRQQFEALSAAIWQGLTTITPHDARGWYHHAGYRLAPPRRNNHLL